MIIGFIICMYLIIHLAAFGIGLIEALNNEKVGAWYPFLTPMDIYTEWGLIFTIIIYLLYFVSTPIFAICTLIDRLLHMMKGY